MKLSEEAGEKAAESVREAYQELINELKGVLAKLDHKEIPAGAWSQP